MTETSTRYVIQMFSKLNGRYTDLEGQLTDGYKTLDEAREAFAAGWVNLKRNLPNAQFQIVERIVTETPHEI